MYIFGNISKIEKYATAKEAAVLKILNIEDNKNYKVKYFGFLPVHEQDSIKGKVNSEMFFEEKPLVVPVETEEYLKQSLFKSLKKSGFGFKKHQEFMRELFEEYKDINNIFKNINSWAADDNNRNFLTEVLTSIQMNKFLRWWKKNYLLRSLYLLGLNNKEIKNSFLPLDVLYKKITSNPNFIHSISIEKANEINILMEKENKKYDIIGGKITRFVYQSNWSSIPLSYIAKAFPEIYVCLEHIKDNFPLVFEDKFVYSQYCYDMEVTLANKILTLLLREQDDKLRSLSLPKVINEIQIDDDIVLTTEQNQALEGSLKNYISVITGGAGCGKTTLIKQIVKNLNYRKEEFVLTSFTGKAVLRIKEVLGKELENKCFTLSLLIKKKKNLIKFTTLIVDEASMISGALFYDFLTFYKHNFKIILVGDNNQLPPIGLCSFFKEIIRSKKIPVYYLKENKRIVNNIKSSNILLNANNLIKEDRNLEISFKFELGKGFEIIEGNKKICYNIINALKKKNISMKEITVLTPYNKDIDEINKYAQNIYLKESGNYEYDNRTFILGDRMMQTANVYNETNEVMNGEEGIITHLSGENLIVKYNDDKIVKYIWKDIKTFNLSDNDFENEETSEKEFLTCDLKHSFCKTVHKSQGSEYDYVIIYLPSSKGNFVNINLLYTAITRTKKTLWIVTEDKKFLDKASRTKLSVNYDRLSERINSL